MKLISRDNFHHFKDLFLSSFLSADFSNDLDISFCLSKINSIWLAELIEKASIEKRFGGLHGK